MRPRLVLALALTAVAAPAALAATDSYSGTFLAGTANNWFTCDIARNSAPSCDTARTLGYSHVSTEEVYVDLRSGCAFDLTATSAGLAPADVDLVLWSWDSHASQWVAHEYATDGDESGVAPDQTYWAWIHAYAGADVRWMLTFSEGPEWWNSAC